MAPRNARCVLQTAMPDLLRDWHLSKSVPIAFILTILMQTAALAWWGASISASTEKNAQDIAILQHVEQVRIRDERELYSRFGRLESTLTTLNSSINRLEERISRSDR